MRLDAVLPIPDLDWLPTRSQKLAYLAARTAPESPEPSVETAVPDRPDLFPGTFPAFVFDRTIDIDTYDRLKERLRQELRLARIDRHATELEEIDVESILAFAERVLPRAADLWVQASLEQRQRLQQLFFPEGIAFDGKKFVRTAVTAPAFNWLQPAELSKTSLVDQTGVEPVTS